MHNKNYYFIKLVGNGSCILPYTHVLDLADFGFIKPHIDSSRVMTNTLTFPINNFALLQFCGSCVAVLSLLSPCVARFRLDQARDQVVDAVIQQRSLYVMKGFSRYECTHEILKNEESYFNGVEIVKGRRVSVICRNEAKS